MQFLPRSAMFGKKSEKQKYSCENDNPIYEYFLSFFHINTLEKIINWLTFKYIEDVLSPDQALEILYKSKGLIKNRLDLFDNLIKFNVKYKIIPLLPVKLGKRKILNKVFFESFVLQVLLKIIYRIFKKKINHFILIYKF